MKNWRRDAHSYAEWDYIYASPFSWDNAIDADQNATETVCVDYLKLILKWILNPGSTKLGPILFAHAVRAWANVVVTQGIAQGVSNIGPSLGRVRKQYWAKIVHNFATREIEDGVQPQRERAVQEKPICTGALRSKLQFLFRYLGMW